MKQIIDKVDRKLALIFAAGVILGVAGLQIVSIFDPTGKADEIRESMCSSVIMACEIEKANCLGKLFKLEGI